MRDRVYPYDKNLYSRSFLNCYQRQSLVMLAERVPNLHHLFYRCLIDTDTILDQIVREQRPRYDFASAFFSREDLLAVGVVGEEVAVDSYAEARKTLLDVVEREGFALAVIDVFYYPHCPEYRNQHVVHTVTCTGYDAGAGQWSIVDDNRASVLCEYTYPEEVLAASYDNNSLRRLRYFTTKGVDGPDPGPTTADRFRDLVAGYRDSLTMFSRIGDVLANEWISRDRAITQLHDALALYQGSRTCLLAYATAAIADPEVAEALRRAVRQAAEALNLLLLGRVTGAIDAAALASRCAVLGTTEQELLTRLRQLG